MKFRLGLLTLVSAFALAATGVAAQSSEKEKEKESIAEMARRLRQQREKNTVAQTVKEFTNDNIPDSRPGAVSTMGTASTAGSSGGSSQADGSAAPSEADEKARADADAALKAETEKLTKLKSDLALMERETKLNKATFYGKPDYASDSAGAANLAAQDAAIAGKKTEITESETKIAELTEKARAINDRLGPKAEEPKTPEQQRDAWAGKIQPLRDELAKVEAELARMQQERTALGNSGSNPPGAFTADKIAQLERRRGELQRQISDIEDDARRAGTLPIRN